MAGAHPTGLAAGHAASKEDSLHHLLGWTTAGTIASSTVSDSLQQMCPWQLTCWYLSWPGNRALKPGFW